MQELQLLLTETGASELELRLGGELDMATAGPLREAVQTAMKSSRYECLVFDLSDLTFMDSTGLHVLTDANRALSATGGAVKVVGASANLRKIFELTGLTAVFGLDDMAIAA